MSEPEQAIADLLHEAADALNRGDLEAYLALIDPEVEFTSLIAEAEGETFHGHEGVRHWWRDIRGAFDEARWEFVDIHQLGEEKAVSYMRITGVLSGVPVEQAMWQSIVMRNGRGIWWRFFRSEEEAREALR